MTHKSLLMLLLILPALLSAGCGEDPQPPINHPPPQRPAAQAPQPGPPPAPERPWPFLSDTSDAGGLADKLTAGNYLLVFDGSGSMTESKCAGAGRKIDVAKKAVAAWAKSVPADANLGLYAFHGQGVSTLPLAVGNRNLFIETIQRVNAGGNTPLAQALRHAYETFTEQGRRQLGYGDYTIVVVTDGIANKPDELQLTVDMILSKTPITIYCIGFCIQNRHSLNQPGLTTYKSADNPEQLQKGLQEVLAESETFDERDFSR